MNELYVIRDGKRAGPVADCAGIPLAVAQMRPTPKQIRMKNGQNVAKTWRGYYLNWHVLAAADFNPRRTISSNPLRIPPEKLSSQACGLMIARKRPILGKAERNESVN